MPAEVLKEQLRAEEQVVAAYVALSGLPLDAGARASSCARARARASTASWPRAPSPPARRSTRPPRPGSRPRSRPSGAPCGPTSGARPAARPKWSELLGGLITSSAAHETALLELLERPPLRDRLPGAADRMSATRGTLLAERRRPRSPVGAPAARAETDEGGLLLGLWRREMNANLAYAAGRQRRSAVPPLRRHEWDHAAALATELAAVGLGTPRPPKTLSDLDATAERLARARGRREVLAAAGALSRSSSRSTSPRSPACPTPRSR